MINLRLITDFNRSQTIVKPTFAGFTPLLLRYGVTTHFLEQGVSLNPIQILMGHNSSKTTELYTQVSVQEIGKIKNPLDDFYKTKSSTIHADLGSIVEQKQKYNGNKHT